MSENKEAVVVRRPGDDVVELSKNLAGMLDLAGAFHQSGMFPNLPSKFAALASVEAGRELGIPPIMALQTIYPIKGRLTIESKGMLALFKRDGGTCKIIKRTAEVAEIVLSKPGLGDPETFTFTIQEATKAGLAGKDNWKGYPADMLFARAVSRGIRSYDPGCILGMSSKEEVEDDDVLTSVSQLAAMPKVEVVPVPEKVKEAPKVIEAEIVPDKPAETPAEVAQTPAVAPATASRRVKPVVPKAQVATPSPSPVLGDETLVLANPENDPEPMMTEPVKLRALWYVKQLKALGQQNMEDRALTRIKTVIGAAPDKIENINDEGAVVILSGLKKLYDKELEKKNGI
jgi:hypothetical protein